MILPALTQQQHAWLLLLQATPEAMRSLFKNGQAPTIEWLFAGTSLNDVKEQGPLLTEITNTPIYQSYQESSDVWLGHIIYTQATQSELLKHLRSLLTIRFYTEDKGILNYFNPQVASYFFKMPEEQLPYWLGPMDLFAWYGGTYLELANEQLSVHYVIRPTQLQAPVFKEESHLTPEQEQLLGECQAQYDLWQWCKVRGISYNEAWSCQQEGIQLAFNGNDLTEYVTLRVKNITQTLPAHFSIQSSAENKLNILKEYWNS